jgi:hypothetical protein
MSPKEQVVLDKFLKEQSEKGYICPSKSPQTSSTFFIYSGKQRLVQDYQYLNVGIKKNNYPLPLISDIIDKVGSAKVFTKLDLRWRYNNVHIKEGDEWKAVFSMNHRAFEPLVMYFSLCNSPTTFQNMMNDIFKDLVDQNVVIVYINDILIYTESKGKHNEIIAEVFKRLEDNDLYVKPEKCEWETETVKFLGMVLSPNGI